MCPQTDGGSQPLRIGLFFDGTGNNAANAPFDDLVTDQGTGSHASALTNVYKLYELYGEPSGRATRAIYVPGIGTVAGEADSLVGSALGRGRTGVFARVDHAIAKVREAMESTGAAGPVTVDLFGFSRGAAAARHCANRLARMPGLQMGFIGLFDTVAAVAGVVKLDLRLDPGQFPDVVHLVARDEHRQKFVLEQVCAEQTELEVPGAHADIGGGYLAQGQEQLLVWPMQALTVARGTPVETTSIYRYADQERQLWLARGWPADWLTVVTPPPTPVLDRTQAPQQQVYAALQLERQVRGELSRVYLRLMHAQALARGVPLMPVPDSGEYALPQALVPLAEGFLRGDFSLSPAQEHMLRLTYIHVSAHWNPPAALQGNLPRIGTRALCINAPAANGERVRKRY